MNVSKTSPQAQPPRVETLITQDLHLPHPCTVKETRCMFERTSSSLFTALLQHDTVKTITLTQPWATLMALEEKRIETRSWAVEYQGPLAIHAAKGFPTWAQLDFVQLGEKNQA